MGIDLKPESNLSSNLKDMDFSEESIKRVVREEGLTHLLTRYPPFVGAGIAALGFIFNMWILYAVGGAVVLIGLTNGFLKLKIFSEKSAQKLLQLKRFALEEQSVHEIAELEEKLKELGEVRAAKQVKDLKDAFKRFREKLDNKVGKDKREYDQYLGSAQKMHLSALHNLNMVADNTLDIRLIDLEDSTNRIKELRKLMKKDGRDRSKEIGHHEKQIELCKQAEISNQDLVAEVEGTITALGTVTRSLSNLLTSPDAIKLSVEKAVERFTETAERNERIYNKVAKSWRKLQG